LHGLLHVLPKGQREGVVAFARLGPADLIGLGLLWLIVAAMVGPVFARPLARLERVVRWSAGLTFALYLGHLPIAQFLTAVSPWSLDSVANRVLVIGGTLVCIVLLGLVTERRKSAWRRFFTTILSRTRPALSPSTDCETPGAENRSRLVPRALAKES